MPLNYSTKLFDFGDPHPGVMVLNITKFQIQFKRMCDSVPILSVVVEKWLRKNNHNPSLMNISLKFYIELLPGSH